MPRKTRKMPDEWKGRRISGPDGRPLSAFFKTEFDKLRITRKKFGEIHGIHPRQVGHALRGDLRTSLRTLAHVALIFGCHLDINFATVSLLEKIAWAAEGIDPCKVEGF